MLQSLQSIVDFVRMMNSEVRFEYLGKVNELRTYFDKEKIRVVNICDSVQHYARLSLTVNKIATLIISRRHGAKLGRGYIREWNRTPSHSDHH